MKTQAILAAAALIAIAPAAYAQGRGGGPPANVGGGGMGAGLGGGIGIGAGAQGGFGVGGPGGDFGATIRQDAWTAQQSGRAADEARARANANSPLGSAQTSTRSSTTVDGDNPGRIQREDARAGRRAPSVVSPQGAAHADANAGLSASATSNSLSNLQTGLTVWDHTGVQLGTVERIERSSDGTVRSVQVATGGDRRRIVRLAPESLSVSGGVVTTTTLSRGVIYVTKQAPASYDSSGRAGALRVHLNREGVVAVLVDWFADGRDGYRITPIEAEALADSILDRASSVAIQA